MRDKFSNDYWWCKSWTHQRLDLFWIRCIVHYTWSRSRKCFMLIRCNSRSGIRFLFGSFSVCFFDAAFSRSWQDKIRCNTNGNNQGSGPFDLRCLIPFFSAQFFIQGFPCLRIVGKLELIQGLFKAIF